MTRGPKTVAPATLAGEALNLMQGRITVLFVVEDQSAGGRAFMCMTCCRSGVA